MSSGDEHARAKLLVRYMDKLRERYPDESSEWVRQRAEALVERDMGPTVSRRPAPPPKADLATSEVAAVPGSATVPNSQASTRNKALESARSGAMVTLVISIVCLVVYVGAKADVGRKADGSAIRQNVAEIVATQWLVASGIFGLVSVGLNLAVVVTQVVAEARDSIVSAIERSSH